MNNIDDILAKLRAGATEEDIANELSKNLNAAVKKLAEEKASLEAAQTKKVYTKCAEEICDTLAMFFGIAGDAETSELFGAANTRHYVQDILEELADLVKSNVWSHYIGLLKSFDGLRADDKPSRKDIDIKINDSDKITNDFDKYEEDIDNIFEKWLKEHGL